MGMEHTGEHQCTTCSQGHPLQVTLRGSLTAPQRWICGGCQRCSETSLDKVRYRCATCDFDLCKSCHDQKVPCSGRVQVTASEVIAETPSTGLSSVSSCNSSFSSTPPSTPPEPLTLEEKQEEDPLTLGLLNAGVLSSQWRLFRT